MTNMKHRCFVLIVMLCIIPSTYAEVKIISTSGWYPTLTGSWAQEGGLTYYNTVHGDRFYNPEWQDMNKSTTINYKTVTRYFYLRPDRARNWKFTMPITNLHAERDKEYAAENRPKLRQRSDQIFWGITIGFKENGVSRTTQIWLKRSAREYYSTGYEALGSAELISYNVDNSGWQTTTYMNRYPSCEPNQAPVLEIDTRSYGHTYIKWGEFFTITDFSKYIEELTYIKIMVGTQAFVQLGKPYAFGEGIYYSIYDASDLIEQENYVMAKQKLYKQDNTYYERPAANLALAYAALNELDKALEICEALISFNGETINYAYLLRGLIREEKGQKNAALEDYKRANDMTNYNRLYNELNAPPIESKQNVQQKSRQQIKSDKPALTK